MTQQPTKLKQVPSPLNPIDGEKMPERVWVNLDPSYIGPVANLFQIALEIADSHWRPCFRGKEQQVIMPLQVPVNMFPQFDRKRYEPFLSSLTFNPQDQIFQVNIRFRKM